MRILITSIVDLKKSQHQTLEKFDQQPFRKSLTKNASPASHQTLEKFDQNVQRFGWITDLTSS